MPEGALPRCSRAGERGAGVSRTRGASSRGTAGEGASPQEGEAHGEETGEALRREQFVPIAGRISAYRRDPAAVRECCLCEGEKSALWPAPAPGGEALRRARGEPSDPAGGNAAALAARPVPGAGKPCCRRESALPARKMLVSAASPCRGFLPECGAPCGKTRRETGCAGRKASV